MINLDKALNLALLNNVCAIVKTYVDNKISALATSLQDILEDVDAEIDNKVRFSPSSLCGYSRLMLDNYNAITI